MLPALLPHNTFKVNLLLGLFALPSCLLEQCMLCVLFAFQAFSQAERQLLHLLCAKSDGGIFPVFICGLSNEFNCLVAAVKQAQGKS